MACTISLPGGIMRARGERRLYRARGTRLMAERPEARDPASMEPRRWHDVPSQGSKSEMAQTDQEDEMEETDETDERTR